MMCVILSNIIGMTNLQQEPNVNSLPTLPNIPYLSRRVSGKTLCLLFTCSVPGWGWASVEIIMIVNISSLSFGPGRVPHISHVLSCVNFPTALQKNDDLRFTGKETKAPKADMAYPRLHN